MLKSAAYPYNTINGKDFFVENFGLRFGFNGKEKDNEIKGNGNSYDFGARIFSSRLGRWLSLDPLQVKYPELSPYNYTANNPIMFVDPDGQWINWFASRGIRDYKRALMQTPQGRLAWRELKESKTEIIIKVTNSVLVHDDNGNLNILSGGTTHPDGLKGKSIINVSLGSYRLKSAIESTTGKNYEDLTIEEKSNAIRNEINTGNYIVEEIDDFNKKRDVKSDEYWKVGTVVSDRPVPNDNESNTEYMNRVGVHEAIHALWDDWSTDNKTLKPQTNEEKREVMPNLIEKINIKDQQLNRKSND